jgi:aldehyde dehydrogenase (NAD+)
LVDLGLTTSLATGKLITSISEATEKDVDLAVVAAQKAFDTVWGLNTPGSKRGEALWSLAQAMERHREELAAIEALDNGEFFIKMFCCIDLMYTFSLGKTYGWAFGTDVSFAIDVIKYFAGWADKITGQTMEV